MVERLKIVLSEQEYRALDRLSEKELRPIADQARKIIRDALERVGQMSQAEEAQSREPASAGAEVAA